MAVGYHIDADEGLITIQARGDVSVAEAQDVGTAILADPKFQPDYPHLFDLRGADLEMTREKSRQFTEFVLHTYMPRTYGTIAVVVDATMNDKKTASLYWLSCAMDKTEIFDDYELALKWLIRREFASQLLQQPNSQT